MKRFLVAVAAMSVIAFSASAYNPPINGDVFYELSSPRQLTNASSVTGGALFYAGPDSLITNPAIPATEQRVDLNIAGTLLFGINSDSELAYGGTGQLGLIIPKKWGVMSFYGNFTSISFEQLDLGNSINLKAGLSKEITDKLNVGINLNYGNLWGSGTDFAISANMGFLYNWGNLGPIKDFRYGVSLLNLGKNYNYTDLPVINSAKESSAFPSIATIKIGAAGSFISNDIFKIGASLDFAFPLFMNWIADVGIQMSFKDFLFITIAEEFNLRESINGHANYIPSIGISGKVIFNANKSEFLDKKGWNQNEMSISAAWKQLYKSINAISAGVDINAGLKDKTPPVIKIMLEDDDEE